MRGIQTNRSWAAIAVACAFLAFVPAAAGKVKPKPGTYSGAGAMIGDPTMGMELAFAFDGSTNSFRLVGFSAPGCSGYVGVPPASVPKRRFTVTSTDTNRTVEIKGRWVSPKELAGTMTMTVVPASTCGTPGTYAYKFGARRYGGQ